MKGRLSPQTTLLLCCDLQTLFENLIFKMKSVLHNSRLIIQAGKVMEIPLLVTEQIPRVFGKTIDGLLDTDPEGVPSVISKSQFSMYTSEVKDYLSERSQIKSIILFGIETHVCVQQTSLDLLELGYEVHILADAVSSQKPYDRTVALQRIGQAGAYLTTTESAIFELLKDSKNPKFKEILPLLKEKSPSDSFL